MNLVKNEQSNKDNYQTFFELSAEGIWRMEFEEPVSIHLSKEDQIEVLYRYGYFAECNDALARMYGLSSAVAFNGVRLGDVLVRTDAANIQALHDFLQSGYRLSDSESHEVDKDGRPLYFLNNLMGVVEDEHLVSVWGTQRDITAEKEAQEKLRFQSKLLDSVGQAVMYADLDGTIQYWNRSAENLYGWNAQEATGLPVSIIVPESSRSSALGIRDLNRSGQPVSTELVLQRKDGTTFPALIANQPVHDSTGTLIGTIGVSSDISVLKKVEASLRESEEQFRTVSEAIPQIVWVTRPDGWHEYYNGRWYDYTGLTPEESIGWGWSGPLHPEDEGRSKKRWDEATSTGQPYEIEYRFRAADGSYRWFLGRALPIRDERGTIVRWFGTCTDIEDQKRNEEKLRESEEKYRLVSKATNDIFFDWDLQNDKVYMDESFYHNLHFPQREIEGHSKFWMERIHPDDIVRVLKAMDEVALNPSRNTLVCDYRVLDGEGSYRHLHSSTFYLRDEEGKLTRAVGALQDITERKQMEEDLKQQGDRLRLALEIGKMGGWEWDFKTQQLLWQYNIDRVQGQPEGSFDGDFSTFMALVHPEDRAIILDRLNRVHLETEWYTIVFRVNGADGQIRWNEGRFQTNYDEEGNPSLLKGISIDITERKQMEEDLRQSEERFASFMDNLPAVAWIKDEAGFYTYVNSAFEKTQKKPLSETLGKREHDLWPKEAADLSEASDRIVLGTLKPSETQEFARYEDEASYTWVTKFPIPDKYGKTQIGGIAIDVTERKQAEMRQSSLLQGLKTVVEIADELLLAPDMDTLLLCAVERARERLGVERCAIFLLPQSGNDVAKGTYGTDKNGGTSDVHDVEFHISGHWIEPFLKLDYKAPGTPRWFLGQNHELLGSNPSLEDMRLMALGKKGWVVMTPILSSHGPRGILFNDCAISASLLDDITQELLVIYCSLLGNLIERQQALDELKQSQQRVIQQERLRAVGEMSSGIAHDVNNSLTPIAGFAELLLMKTDYNSDIETTKRLLSYILTSSQDAASTIGRLKEFYRHREGRDVLNPVDLNLLVEQVVELTEPKWKDQAQTEGKNIGVRTELHALPPIAGDNASLREALTNFIFNAVDAIPPPGGTITLATRLNDEKHRVLLEVRDTGAGMDEVTRARCLEPFFTTKGEQGTGLGLSVVYGIVQRHDATIEIESQPGEGTTLRLGFPVGSVENVTPKVENETRPDGIRILLVEDEPLVCEMLTMMLSDAGHAVEFAVDGEQGLKSCLEGNFDLVITDRAMPKMNGEQLTTAIKSEKPGMKVLMLTGFGEFMNASGECPAGVDIVLSKPVSVKALANAIESIMDKGSSLPSLEMK